MRLIGLDPSMRSSGVAVFGRGLLVAADRILIQRDAIAAITARCRAMAVAVLDWVEAPRGDTDGDTDGWDLATEYPQAYAPGRRGAGPPGDLIPMGLVIGGVAARCPGSVHQYLPGQWTGQLAKTLKGDPRGSPRGERIWSRLDGGERAVAAGCLQHDAWDAIGIGLHHLGRLAPRRGKKPGT
jgi:hypothetical protein